MSKINKKKKKAPIIVKRDTAENWEKAVNYIPNPNVMIIIEKEDGTHEVKIGNGEDLIKDLPNLLIDIDKTPKVEDGTLTIL